LPWLGGSILTSLSTFQSMWMWREFDQIDELLEEGLDEDYEITHGYFAYEDVGPEVVEAACTPYNLYESNSFNSRSRLVEMRQLFITASEEKVLPDLEKVEDLLKSNTACMGYDDADDWNPLHYARYYQGAEMCRLLLKHGALEQDREV